MIRRWIVHHHRRVAIVGVMAWLASLVTYVVLIVAYDLDFFGPLGGPWVIAFSLFVVAGAIITWQRADHVLGPVFLVMGLIAPLGNAVIAAAMGPYASHEIETRALFVAIGFAMSSAMFPLLPLALTLFPDGNAPTRRWQWVGPTAAAASIVGGLAALTTGRWGGDRDQVLIEPPFDGRFEPLGSSLASVFDGLVIVLVVGSATAVTMRYRRSDTTVRRQIKWVLLAVTLSVMLLMTVMVVSWDGGLRLPTGVPTVVAAGGIGLIPASVAVAILRHRLFDIDLALNRTMVFGILATFITAFYVTVVVGIGSLWGDPSNLALSVAATALVAVAFEPVRARVQHWANLAVYGSRASPYEVLAELADDLASIGAADNQLEAMARLLADGSAADHTTVWVGDDETLRAAACWPPHDPSHHAPLTVTAGQVAATPAETAHLEPVRLGDELLGALSLDRGRDDPMSPKEQQMVAELAGQASLVLGNARLRERLGARLEELRESRRRLVATQDEARRRLERDLHDGAQQQLVALKVKLGMARTLAERDGAGESVRGILDRIADTADTAVDGLRSLARGIYPPLLEAEGLERAIRSHAERVGVDVTVRTTGVERYERDVEATVYFCVVEVLANAVRHADAARIDIELADHGSRLTLVISDDGRGFDPAHAEDGTGLRNMADRVEAIEGLMDVVSRPSAGCRIQVTIPSAVRSDMPGQAPASTG